MKRDINILTGRNVALATWISIQQGHRRIEWDKFNTLYFMRGERPLVGWLYTAIGERNIAVHCAAHKGAFWCIPEVLYHVFGYPFVELRASRLTAPISVKNKAAWQTAESLGFKLEGRMREAEHTGADVLLYGMLRRECRWIHQLEAQDALAA